MNNGSAMPVRDWVLSFVGQSATRWSRCSSETSRCTSSKTYPGGWQLFVPLVFIPDNRLWLSVQPFSHTWPILKVRKWTETVPGVQRLNPYFCSFITHSRTAI